jgi:hypothetical protein
VVYGSQSAVWSAHSSTRISQALEGLWRCNLVDEMSVNVDGVAVDDMVGVDLVVQGGRGGLNGRHIE